MNTARKRRSSEKSWQSVHSDHSDITNELKCCIFDGLTRLWQSELLFDYTIHAEGKTYRIHRTVLASVSDYFYAMFTSGMRESQQDFVELKGVNSHMLELLIEFVYTGELLVTEQNVVELLNAASHVQIATAVKICLAFMHANITTDNCVEMLDISRLHSSEKDFEKLEDFVAENFSELLETGNYLKLSFDSLKGLLCREELLFGPEYELCKAVMAWVDHDPGGRSRYFITLMQHIRFPLMTIPQIKQLTSFYPQLTQNSHSLAQIGEAEEYLAKPVHQRVLHQSVQTRLRINPSLLVIQEENTLDWFAYQPDRHQWYTMVPAGLTETSSAECVVVNDFLIVCGGMMTEEGLEEKVTGKCFIFDPREYRWSALASMSIPRQDFALLCHSEHLYAIAGSMVDEISVTEKIERYSFEHDQWETFTTMYPSWRPSYCVSACVLKNHIYMCDGSPEDIVEGVTPNQLTLLDIETRVWKKAAISVEEKCGFPMWQHNKQIYTIENDNAVVNTPTITWYDSRSGTCGAVLCPEVLSKAKIVATEDQVFFINGCLMDAKDNYHTNLCTQVTIDSNTHVATVRQLDFFPDKETTEYCVRLRLPWQQIIGAVKPET